MALCLAGVKRSRQGSGCIRDEIEVKRGGDGVRSVVMVMVREYGKMNLAAFKLGSTPFRWGDGVLAGV